MYTKEFSDGILWAVAVILLAMGMVYAVGTTPNPTIVIGPILAALYFRHKDR